jgi:MerR family transcriptional regulator, light-induced transcriptional regulator
MNTYMEQFAETERWIGRGQHGLESPSNPVSDENPWASADDLPRARRKALLTSVVEAEILPRLARLRRHTAATGPIASAITGTSAMTTDRDSQELVGLVLNREASAAAGFVDSLRRRGATPASLFLGVVTRAAQILGEMWDQDRCDFAQVTISMGRLQQVLRTLSPHFQMESVTRTHAETALLAPGPGEQHTFGLLVLGEFFRREGWHVAGGPATSASDAVLIVRRTWVDVAGFSIGSAARLEGLTQCIRAVRRASRNPNLYVMVGGPLFLTRPGLVARTGADASANDAAAAVRQANGLLGMGAAAD